MLQNCILRFRSDAQLISQAATISGRFFITEIADLRDTILGCDCDATNLPVKEAEHLLFWSMVSSTNGFLVEVMKRLMKNAVGDKTGLWIDVMGLLWRCSGTLELWECSAQNS